MIYFFGWVAFIVAIFAAIPIGLIFDKRPRVKRKKAVREEEVAEPLEPLLEDEIPEESELERRLRRFKIMAEGMSEEEMFAHAKATLELATILRNENRTKEADMALEILVNQPGIGNRYLTRCLAKRAVVLQELGEAEELDETITSLRETYATLQAEDPEGVPVVYEEMDDDERNFLNSL